ncbi:MAG: RNA 2',3'-cyclic phosphodiesterase [Rhodospirillales bacterium]|nr:RNA 2',3'-cyclic phosphodiesterase [Rhodospirillales bacterium]
MLRLFVGLQLPEELRSQLAGISSGIVGARWLEPENMHMTLRFIGEVPEDTGEDIDAALSHLSAYPVEIEITGTGSFQSRDRARAVWAGINLSPGLADLQARVEAAMQRAGLAPEHRKFLPHVTLARLKRVPVESIAPYLEAHGDLKAAPFTANEVALFQSHLGHAGASYQILATYPLAGGG